MPVELTATPDLFVLMLRMLVLIDVLCTAIELLFTLKLKTFLLMLTKLLLMLDTFKVIEL